MGGDDISHCALSVLQRNAAPLDDIFKYAKYVKLIDD